MKRVEDWIVAAAGAQVSVRRRRDARRARRAALPAALRGVPRVSARAKVGKVTPIEEIGTDRNRLDSFTYEFAANMNLLYAGYPWRFTHFRKTNGYANMPLDGVWLRAPYLHNGSVPTLRDLLEAAGMRRPKTFYRGYDVYDQQEGGVRFDRRRGRRARSYFLYDTSLPGNGNGGHLYGTQLPSDRQRRDCRVPEEALETAMRQPSKDRRSPG